MLLTVTQKLLEGFGTSCIIFIVTLLAALPLGLVIAFGSMSRFKPIAWLTRGFVWIMRGTPLMLQLMIVYYGPGLLWEGNSVSKLSAVLIAFSINYAYFSEIYRGGIVVKRIVPPLGNEMMTLVKDTSLARVIACKEIIMIAQEYMSVKGLIWPLFYSGLFYLLFCGALTVILGRVEKKLDYFRV